MAFYCVTEGRNAGKKQSFLARIFSAPLMAATLFQFVVDTVLCVTVSGRRFLYSCLPFSNLKYLYRLYPQFTRKTVRRHKICVLLRCFDSMYARYMSFKACFTWHKFYAFCLWRVQTERISSFSRQTKKAYRGVC